MKAIQNELVLNFKRGDGKNQSVHISDCREDLATDAILEATAGILAAGVLAYDGAMLVALNSAVKVHTEREPVLF